MRGSASVRSARWLVENWFILLCQSGSGADRTVGFVGRVQSDLAVHGFCLLFCVLATCKIILAWELTCDSVHLWRSYSAA